MLCQPSLSFWSVSGSLHSSSECQCSSTKLCNFFNPPVGMKVALVRFFLRHCRITSKLDQLYDGSDKRLNRFSVSRHYSHFQIGLWAGIYLLKNFPLSSLYTLQPIVALLTVSTFTNT